ncbi:four helix bundle protein [Kaarinaea lacus]
MRNKPLLENLALRTKRFALEIIRLYGSLPKSAETEIIGRRLLRSGTLVGSCYRDAVRATNAAMFISKLEHCLHKIEETTYWIELLEEAAIGDTLALTAFKREASELAVKIMSLVKDGKPQRRNLREMV